MSCYCGSGTTRPPLVVHVMGLQGPRGLRGERGEKGEKGDPGSASDVGAVSFDKVQTLTAEQKAIARLNIGSAREEDIVVPDLKSIYLNARDS